MIDGEEVLESAQETGYRLCVAHEDKDEGSDDFSQIFSATWDPCNKDRLYVCSQKGSLRIYNIKTKASRDFCVQFKRYTSDSETLIEGRPVNHHWDKMVPIPERPDEFVFLLGVSKNLMYTALPGMEPYPEEPFLSKTTRSDFTGKFIISRIVACHRRRSLFMNHANFAITILFCMIKLFISCRLHLWHSDYGAVDASSEGDIHRSFPGRASISLRRRAGQFEASYASTSRSHNPHSNFDQECCRENEGASSTVKFKSQRICKRTYQLLAISS